MMIIISLLLLSLLFLAGFLNIFFHFPTDKFFHAWLKYTPPPDTKSSPVSSPRKERSPTPSPQNKAELKRVFATFDKNGDGFITKQELRESLRNIRIFMTEKEVEEIVAKVDANGDGLIEFDEFCMLCESMAGGGKEEEEEEEGGGGGGGEEELKEAFDVFDKDRDGLITVEELGVVLSALGMKEGKKAEDCKEMITKVDMDGDGMVNFDEFKRMMKGGSLLLAH